jgi:ADP-ribose pyrophosphatase YjhB (NUDIX family)
MKDTGSVEVRREKRFCPLCGNRLEKISHDHRMRLVCTACKKPLYENPLPATAAVILDHGDHLLLVKRKMEPAKGKWCLPGGFVELDEGPAQGVVRELAEETGLIGEVEHLLDCVYEDNPFYGPVIIMGYQLTARGGKLMAGDDAAAVQYFPLAALPPIAFDSHQTIINKITRKNG